MYVKDNPEMKCLLNFSRHAAVLTSCGFWR